MMIDQNLGQKKQKFWFVTISLLLILAGLIYSGSRSAVKIDSDKISIVASFYPLADFGENVGRNYVQVANITPAGAEPHDYEPTPQDIAKIYKAKLFVFNGNGLDNWADKIRDDLEKNGVMVIKMSEYVDSFQNDPHFWLSPLNAIKEVNVIADALINVDPTHKEEYNKNRDNYVSQLLELDKEFRSGLADCEYNEIITSHDAFGYLSKEYGFKTLYILSLSADAEPTAKAIADLSSIAKEKGIKYIFFETLVSPRIAETIANEIGGKTLVLNPIEGLTSEEIKSGKDYVSIMKDNLTNLRIALQCK